MTDQPDDAPRTRDERTRSHGTRDPESLDPENLSSDTPDVATHDGGPEDGRTQQERALDSLAGLTVGDAFGQRFFASAEQVQRWLEEREPPPGPWRLTDDSILALGLVKVLETHGEVVQDALISTFAEFHARDPHRGYGPMTAEILSRVHQGEEWRELSGGAFGGEGSFGNGGAMRVAPLGAYFAGDLEHATDEARLSAQVTHSHPEGQAGAVAVAVAAAWASAQHPTGPSPELLGTALEHTPDGVTREGIVRAAELGLDAEVEEAVDHLGNGSRITAQDTVPYVLWCAARHAADYEEALWTTVSGGGDRDTTCAMVGGIVAGAHGRGAIPAQWLERREELDPWR